MNFSKAINNNLTYFTPGYLIYNASILFNKMNSKQLYKTWLRLQIIDHTTCITVAPDKLPGCYGNTLKYDSNQIADFSKVPIPMENGE